MQKSCAWQMSWYQANRSFSIFQPHCTYTKLHSFNHSTILCRLSMPCHVPLPRSIAARCANPAPPAVRPPRRRCCRRPPRSSPTHRHPTTVCPRQRNDGEQASTFNEFHTLSTFNWAIAKKFADFFRIISLRFKAVDVSMSQCESMSGLQIF